MLIHESVCMCLYLLKRNHTIVCEEVSPNWEMAESRYWDLKNAVMSKHLLWASMRVKNPKSSLGSQSNQSNDSLFRP